VKPDGTGLRRERRLFSQDVGEPIVHLGLLYWPLEDTRVSLGWGQIAVTDGRDWRVLESRTGRQFDLHGLFPGQDNSLLAAGSAWSAQILGSTDGGRSWTQFFEAERLEKRFSRTYQIATTPTAVFGDIIEFGNGPRTFAMLRHDESGGAPVPGWPETEGLVRRAVPWGDGLLVLRGFGKSLELGVLGDAGWRRVELPAEVVGIDIAAGQDIWLLGKAVQGHSGLWRRKGRAWRQELVLDAGEAIELRMGAGQPLVAGTLDRRGAIWGTGEAQSAADKSPALPEQIAAEPNDEEQARQQIADALADPRSYVGHGIRLRNVIDRWVMRGLPGEVLASFLDGPFPEGEVKLIGGRAFASHERFGRWILTWGMRRAGGGRVPPEWLDLPFDEAENDSQKYFGEKIAAIWTVAATGQNDRATMAALRRVETDDTLPEWLRQDAAWAIYALSAR